MRGQSTESPSPIAAQKHATGHALRWAVVPASESLLHAGVVGSNLSLLFARPFRRRTGLLDVSYAMAPAVSS